MSIDIIAIDNTKNINNINSILSTMPTGRSSILAIRLNDDPNLTIANIQSKYADKFDDITYYTIGSGSL